MYEDRKTQLWIGGRDVAPSSGRYFEDYNPLDDSVYGLVADATVADVDSAVIQADQAFESNRGRLPIEREKWLLEAAVLMERDQAEFIDILIDEVGSPVMKARFEVAYAISALRAAAGVPRRIRGEVIPSDNPSVYSMAIREPVGVVAAISPFNVPLLKVTKQGVMPIACGNATVHMPSEFATRVSLRFARLLDEAGVPPGLFNVITGNPFEIGDALTTHPLVRSISFCGSPRVGRHVAQLAAKDLKPALQELGGKSPFIVLADADIDAAVEAAANSIFFFQGQACMAASRIFLHTDIAEEFTVKFREKAEGAGMGDLRDPATMVGPIISERQRERVRRHIEDARGKGAEFLVDGQWEGNRCPPVVLLGVTEDMEVCRNETFGPVTSIYTFDEPAEVMEKANDTEYGLSFSVWTRNIEMAMAMAQQAKSGAVHINRGTIQDEPHPPFGGKGLSGMGREGTEADLDILTEWKWITINNPGFPGIGA